ncbi:hypothetical protein UVI_02045570 [Ustilaginoidea virens]|uniref:Uncharacterized protein n=1 Tax=Ustilaginoidea virens TaxID=1159556 RepID=A0A1B5L9I8_USTVR|nr:hypothetical protein UVI_02045570 [Ustilaginoidea virens]
MAALDLSQDTPSLPGESAHDALAGQKKLYVPVGKKRHCAVRCGDPMPAGLNVTEPCSTGIGGDMFLLFWDAAARQVRAVNGSGRAGRRCTLDAVRSALKLPGGGGGDDDGDAQIPLPSALAVTVPGAAAGWVDAVERFGSGKVDMRRVLAPAVELGEKGFPVSEGAAYLVCFAEERKRKGKKKKKRK